MRDWQAWHEDYTDPESALSQRLAVVQHEIRSWANRAAPGPLRLLSICAGQGHDVAGALAGHARSADVSGLLVELDPDNAALANEALRDAGLSGVRAVVGDAGLMSSYDGAVPADLVLVCGVFGNISDTDVRRTTAALPMLCAPGATVMWTRHRGAPDLTPSIRTWFTAAGFEEIRFASPGEGSYAVCVQQLNGPPQPFRPELQLFTFVR